MANVPAHLLYTSTGYGWSVIVVWDAWRLLVGLVLVSVFILLCVCCGCWFWWVAFGQSLPLEQLADLEAIFMDANTLDGHERVSCACLKVPNCGGIFTSAS